MAYAYGEEDVSTEEDTEASSGQDTQDDGNDVSRELEDALVQSALTRIRRAQQKGKQDVKLSKEELGALERRRKRLEEEAKAKSRQASSGSERRRRKEQRIAVPLSQFDPPVTRKSKSGASKSDDALPRHPSPATVNPNPGRTPPMGLFPPPNGSRTRPRSATSSSHRNSPGQASSSPFDYSYVQSPRNHRNVSDSSSRSSPSRLPYPSDDGERRPSSSSSSRNPRDPFQYQTAGPRAPTYVSGAGAARRNMPGPSGSAYGNVPRGTVPAAARNNGSSEETSDGVGDGDSTSDDVGSGAHVTRSRTRTPEDAIVVEEASPSPEPERPKSKRSSSRVSPVKRKPVSGNGGGRRRKKN